MTESCQPRPSRRTVLARGLAAIPLGIGAVATTTSRTRARPPAADDVEFVRTYESGQGAHATAVVQTRDGGFALTGWRDTSGGGSEGLLVKTDRDGDVEFERTYGGPDRQELYSVVQTRDGGFALGGWTTSFGAGGFDGWLVRTDDEGVPQFARTYGGGDRDRIRSVVRTRPAGFAFAGDTRSTGAGVADFWLVTTEPDGTPTREATYGGSLSEGARALVQSRDRGFALAGTTLSFGAGGNDAWVVKTDAAGRQEFSTAVGGSGFDLANDLVETRRRGYALAGVTTSSGSGGDAWLVKLDWDGSIAFERTYGGPDADGATALIQTRGRGFALTGYAESTGLRSDALLVETDADGTQRSSTTFSVGPDTNDRARDIVKARGGYALTGETTDATDTTRMFLVKTRRRTGHR